MVDNNNDRHIELLNAKIQKYINKEDNLKELINFITGIDSIEKVLLLKDVPEGKLKAIAEPILKNIKLINKNDEKDREKMAKNPLSLIIFAINGIINKHVNDEIGKVVISSKGKINENYIKGEIENLFYNLAGNLKSEEEINEYAIKISNYSKSIYDKETGKVISSIYFIWSNFTNKDYEKNEGIKFLSSVAKIRTIEVYFKTLMRWKRGLHHAMEIPSDDILVSNELKLKNYLEMDTIRQIKKNNELQEKIESRFKLIHGKISAIIGVIRKEGISLTLLPNSEYLEKNGENSYHFKIEPNSTYLEFFFKNLIFNNLKEQNESSFLYKQKNSNTSEENTNKKSKYIKIITPVKSILLDLENTMLENYKNELENLAKCLNISQYDIDEFSKSNSNLITGGLNSLKKSVTSSTSNSSNLSIISLILVSALILGYFFYNNKKTRDKRNFSKYY
jgi:hypothetical protein